MEGNNGSICMRLTELVASITFFMFLNENDIIPFIILYIPHIFRLFFSSFFARFAIEFAALTP